MSLFYTHITTFSPRVNTLALPRTSFIACGRMEVSLFLIFLLILPMFDSIKEAMKMKGIHDQLKKERVTVEKNGISVTINGTFVVENITLSDTLTPTQQAPLITECLNDAFRKLQMKLATTFSGKNLL